ncbi:hypothetical protein GCM10023336_70590 [Streptomyces similanensis]|uniref:Uncharacterized protein n=1 Tax=Streptomyces similanensis TaxID=1274988 RepID=A0ABP9LHK7_9ACTN
MRASRRQRALKAAAQEKRRAALIAARERREATAAAVARGRQSRAAARQQIKWWDMAGLDAEPKKERKPKSVWVSVISGGSPGLGR